MDEEDVVVPGDDRLGETPEEDEDEEEGVVGPVVEIDEEDVVEPYVDVDGNLGEWD